MKTRRLFFPFDWDEKDIWKIEAPLTEIKHSELEGLLDVDWFGTDENPLTPNEVMSNPELDMSHFNRILKADMAFAIDLGLNPRVNKLVPFDGLHRMCKAKMFGIKTLKCRSVPIEKVLAFYEAKGNIKNLSDF